MGGARKTEYPFRTAPGWAMSTGAYLLGLDAAGAAARAGAGPARSSGATRTTSCPPLDRRYLLFGSDERGDAAAVRRVLLRGGLERRTRR